MGAAAFTALALLLGPAAGHAAAQTINGRVLEEGGERPVAGAAVYLLDRDGKKRAQSLSDSIGRFHITPPKEGDYYLAAERIGYRDTRSPLLALKTTGTADLDLMMAPEPVALEGLEVNVEQEAKDYLQNFGLTPRRLGNRWIDRAKIDSLPTFGGAREVLRWSNIPGVSVREERGLSPALCVYTERRSAHPACALVVVNGTIMPLDAAGEFVDDAKNIEAITVLGATEATTFYGTQAAGGAVLIWTRRGQGR